jgi:hypothetical protein
MLAHPVAWACLVALTLPAAVALASDEDASREGPPPAPPAPAVSASGAAGAPGAAGPPVTAAAPVAAAACPPEAGSTCPVAYQRYVNTKFAFSVDVPTFLIRKGADADGRGQPFAYGTKARARAWAMYNVPQMSLGELFGDWTRRAGITFQAQAMNTWVVRGQENGKYYYSRSILADGIITSIEITYDPSIAEAMEPVLARMGPSLQALAGQGPRAAKAGAE